MHHYSKKQSTSSQSRPIKLDTKTINEGIRFSKITAWKKRV